MPALEITLAAVALLGHSAFCAGAVNRLHASALHKPLLKTLEKTVFLAAVAVPVAVWLWLFRRESPTGSLVAAAYFWLSFGHGIFVAGRWCLRTLTPPPGVLVGTESRVLHVDRQLPHRPCGDVATHWLARIPGNQIFQLEVNRKEIRLPCLPAELDGLTIVHLSDLHFTGHLTREFFDAVVDQANALNADLVAITGDLLDKPPCLPWIVECLGRLRARLGVFAILGNHDLHFNRDPGPILRELSAAGIEYVGGGRTKRLETRGRSLLLAGNELPWWRHDRDVSEPSPNVELSRDESARPLRILLSHSPDQIAWAVRRDFDLMLAGHTHGGQIRLPLIGPILAHSHYGVKYASGVFYVPPTVLHVSRGLSGVENVRFFCRPELTALVLRVVVAGPAKNLDMD